MSSTKESSAVKVGVVGCGGFGLFAVQQFVQHPDVAIAAIGGTTRDEARRVADRYGIEVRPSAEAVLDDPDIDLVYINTPPALHFPQCQAALERGKHVLVEKPLAVTVDQGRQLVDAARQQGRVCVANLMQRYNPVAQRIADLLDRHLLGEALFFSLENHAVDEGLQREHWFWDESISGGIFIEHGVHFFDLARWWFGELTIRSAGQSSRSDGAVDQVWCDTASESALCRFYHGFNRASRLEQQLWHIVCEHGSIRMDGWIPLGIEIEALVDNAGTRSLTAALPGYRLDVLENLGGHSRSQRGHGLEFLADQKIRLSWSPGIDKQTLYSQLLRDMFADQIAYVRNPSHQRQITEENGLLSLVLAAQATQLAKAGGGLNS